MKLFREQIFIPLLRELSLPKNTLSNSVDDLIQAISSGRITYYRGQFKGRFNSTISRELKKLGAEFDRKQGSFRLTLSEMPYSLRSAISLSDAKMAQTVRKFTQKLQDIFPDEVASQLNLEDLFDTAIWRVDKDIKASMKAITVTPQLSAEDRAKIAKEYTNNMRLYVKAWTEKEIKDMRAQVEKSASLGLRREDLAKMIVKKYEVSHSKAKFLAKQETSLLMAKFKEVRYQDAGVNEYKWTTVIGSPKHPVRPAHKKLAGKIFRFDDPPVSSENGARNNPGQDYGCRCTAIPIVRFK